MTLFYFVQRGKDDVDGSGGREEGLLLTTGGYKINIYTADNQRLN